MTEPSAPVPPPRRPQTPPPPPGVPAVDPLQQLIQAQTGTPRGDATAYLRAGAHLDPAFRDAVIEELAEHPYRVPPPTPGVDLVAVLAECYAARRQAVARAVLVLLAAAVVPVLTVCAVLAVAEGGPAGALDPLLRIWLLQLALPLALVAAWLVRSGRPGRRRLGHWLAVGWALTSAAAIGWPWIAGLVAVWFAVALAGHRRLELTLHDLGTGRAAAPEDPDPAHQDLYRRLARQQADPDVVYSDYAPFVGAGIEVDHWSFADELVPDPTAGDPADFSAGPPAGPSAGPSAGPDAARAPLTAPAVHARLRTELARLGAAGAPASPGDRLHGIAVDDLVFKSGKRLGPAGDWCGHGPGTAFAALAPYAARCAAALNRGLRDPAGWWVESVDLAAEERLRHFLAVRVSGWHEEIVVTVFVRAQLQGGQLFLESRAFVLPPVARAYHAIDTATPATGAAEWTGLAAAALLSLPALVAGSAGVVRRAARSRRAAVRNAAWYARMCRENRLVDHGPALSVRELGAEPAYQQLFQEMDVQRYLKCVRARIVTAVQECLREHGYRTEGARALQNVVVNHGVQVHGDVHGVVQSGESAAAWYQPIATPAPRVGSPRPD
ncbi:hypothetical protein ACIRS1_34480 [Kitasatospora sp. NPDC101176]|uniref:hypothetical protein n=1 Tax=Kitasatospora sp. NPDC101176 TaxID=3364099 RepID=UPI0037F7DA0F